MRRSVRSAANHRTSSNLGRRNVDPEVVGEGSGLRQSRKGTRQKGGPSFDNRRNNISLLEELLEEGGNRTENENDQIQQDDNKDVEVE